LKDGSCKIFIADKRKSRLSEFKITAKPQRYAAFVIYESYFLSSSNF